jgi:3-oxoadipate enol-lactonase
MSDDKREIKTERILENPTLAIDHAGEGELLILMHGIGGNRTNWTEQIEVFSEYFHTVAWDARGYGESDDYDGPLDFNDFSRDLKRVLDYFGVEKAHISGLSMGGRISQSFYAMFPERVKTLTLVATFTGFNNFSDAEKQKFLDLRLKPLVEEGKDVMDIAPVVAKTLVGPHATEAQYQQLVDSMKYLHKESYIKTVRATTMFDQTANLENISVPTLLVFGENDSLTNPTIGKTMADRITGCEFKVIPKSGHLINLEQSQLFTETMLEFLLKHRG